MPIKVLVVDDSAVVRQTLTRDLSKDPDIEIVGAAVDPFVARDMVVALRPQVITLDIEMPRMDGLTFLRKLMQYMPTPTIVLSSLSPQGSETAFEALQAGAVEVMCKPGVAYAVGDMIEELKSKIKVAACIDMKKMLHMPSSKEALAALPKVSKTTQKLIILGASTGGTKAIEYLLRQFPPDAPGTVIVQHMPAGFTRAFAYRLNEICDVTIKEAEHGDCIEQGHVLIAPGNYHMKVRRSGASYFVDITEGPLVSGHRPSVDVLFMSAAQNVGRNAIGIILTGMGGDGAKGMLKMREAGAINIAQDEDTSVVFGMPKVAIEVGAVHHIVPLNHITTKSLQIAAGM